MKTSTLAAIDSAAAAHLAAGRKLATSLLSAPEGAALAAALFTHRVAILNGSTSVAAALASEPRAAHLGRAFDALTAHFAGKPFASLPVGSLARHNALAVVFQQLRALFALPPAPRASRGPPVAPPGGLAAF